MYENKSENIIQLFSLSLYKGKIGLTESERKILIEERISISDDISIITKESENIENLITPIDKWMKF